MLERFLRFEQRLALVLGNVFPNALGVLQGLPTLLANVAALARSVSANFLVANRWVFRAGGAGGAGGERPLRCESANVHFSRSPHWSLRVLHRCVRGAFAGNRRRLEPVCGAREKRLNAARRTAWAVDLGDAGGSSIGVEGGPCATLHPTRDAGRRPRALENPGTAHQDDVLSSHVISRGPE